MTASQTGSKGPIEEWDTITASVSKRPRGRGFWVGMALVVTEYISMLVFVSDSHTPRCRSSVLLSLFPSF
jgi:hypothetical protein